MEHGSFTPIVLSATGGMGNAAQVTFKRMVSMLAVKRDQPYSQVMNVVRCMLNFSLLKSQIRCIRGSRSSMGHAVKTPTCMIASEGVSPQSNLPLHKIYITAIYICLQRYLLYLLYFTNYLRQCACVPTSVITL